MSDYPDSTHPKLEDSDTSELVIGMIACGALAAALTAIIFWPCF